MNVIGMYFLYINILVICFTRNIIFKMINFTDVTYTTLLEKNNTTLKLCLLSCVYKIKFTYFYNFLKIRPST